jgi:hypothetical protein
VQQALPAQDDKASTRMDAQAERRAQEKKREVRTGKLAKGHADAPSTATTHAQVRERTLADAPREPAGAEPQREMRDTAPLRAETAASRGAQKIESAAPEANMRAAQDAAAVGSASAPAPAAAPVPKAAPAAAPLPPPAPAPPARAFRQLRRADSGVTGSASVAAVIAELSGRPAAEWRERIVLLRREGRRQEADALLEEFKRRYPDEPAPVEAGDK